MHLDMDAFYAAIEQQDHPELQGRPVIVGGLRRGVVAAASYEARQYGVFSAMPIFQARQLCPAGVFLPVRQERYREVSRQIMGILETISPLVEQVSIDEAYVDLNGTGQSQGAPEALARWVKAEIRSRTGLTCSIGLAPNKLLAKIASDLHKPDGLTVVSPDRVLDFLQPLPLARLPGIGPKTLARLQTLGLTTVGEIWQYSPSFWRRQLGKTGLKLFARSQGQDNTPVRPYIAPKSYSAEETLPEDTADPELIREQLLRQAERLGEELRQDNFKGQTISLKLKYADFQQINRSHTLGLATDSTQIIFHTALKLLSEIKLRRKIRLVGIGVANLQPRQVQGVLLPDPRLERQERLEATIDRIRKKFGPQALFRGGWKKLPKP